jgi:regulatory protein
VAEGREPGRAQGRPRRRTPEARAERIAAHAAESDPAAVMAAAVRLLETRSRTVADLRGRLLRSGYPASLVDAAAQRLVEVGLLDDDAYARDWLDSRDRVRPRGERVLRQELRLRGVPGEIAAAALEARREAAEPGEDGAAGDTGSADDVAATRLIERRRAALDRIPDPRIRRQRAFALLARNGFNPDVAARVAARVAHLAAGGDEPEDEVEAAD